MRKCLSFCIYSAVVAKTVPVHRVSTAFLTKTPPFLVAVDSATYSLEAIIELCGKPAFLVYICFDLAFTAAVVAGACGCVWVRLMGGDGGGKGEHMPADKEHTLHEGVVVASEGGEDQAGTTYRRCMLQRVKGTEPGGVRTATPPGPRTAHSEEHTEPGGANAMLLRRATPPGLRAACRRHVLQHGVWLLRRDPEALCEALFRTEGPSVLCVPLPSTQPLPCVSATFVTKTLPLTCVSTAFVAKTLPVP